MRSAPRSVLASLLALGMTAATLTPASAIACTGCGGPPSGNTNGAANESRPGDADWLQIACRVPGDQSETASDDLRFTNTGARAIPRRTSVFWQVKQLNQSGSFELPRDLLAGETIDAFDLLSTPLPANTRCLVRLG